MKTQPKVVKIAVQAEQCPVIDFVGDRCTSRARVMAALPGQFLETYIKVCKFHAEVFDE